MPLASFDFAPPLTHPTLWEWEKKLEEVGVKYKPGKEVKIGETKWLSIEACNYEGKSIGYVLLPPRYYPVWRRLLWGAAWFWKMWRTFEEEAKTIPKKKGLSKYQKWVMYSRRASALRLTWYTTFRREILWEVLDTRFDHWTDDEPEENPVLARLVEFGIRDLAGWLFDSFGYARKKEPLYLRLDPMSPKNLPEFRAFCLRRIAQRITLRQ